MTKQKRRSTVTSLKAISCRCLRPRGATELDLCPVGIKYKRKLWVCAECLKPFKMYAEAFVTRCENCLDEFSSPWHDICEKCHTIEYSDIKLVEGRVVRAPLPDAPVYLSWATARALQRKEREQKRLRWDQARRERAEKKSGPEVISA